MELWLVEELLNVRSIVTSFFLKSPDSGISMTTLCYTSGTYICNATSLVVVIVLPETSVVSLKLLYGLVSDTTVLVVEAEGDIGPPTVLVMVEGDIALPTVLVVVEGDIAPPTVLVMVEGDIAPPTVLVMVEGDIAPPTVLVMVEGDIAPPTVLVVEAEGDIALPIVLVMEVEEVEVPPTICGLVELIWLELLVPASEMKCHSSLR